MIEPAADIVGREIVGCLEIDPKQILHGVVVFRPVEPPDGDAPGVGRGITIDVINGGFNPADQLLPFRL